MVQIPYLNARKWMLGLRIVITTPDIVPIKLKTPGYQSLEDTRRIILMRDPPQKKLIPPPIARDGVLRLQCIVQVHILIVLFFGFRELNSLAEKGFCGFVDGAVVIGEGPLDGQVEDCGVWNEILERGQSLESQITSPFV